MPTGAVYRTDGNNNGFFVFDSLTPGNYQVVFNAGDYKTDTISVTAQANKSVFTDVFLSADPDKQPFVRSFSPKDSSSDFNTYSDFSVQFSRAMNTASVEQAFSVTPHQSGFISWQEENRKLVFSPDTAYSEHTAYLVQISDSAKSASGAFLDTDFKLYFTTADSHDYPQVISYFPAEDSVYYPRCITGERACPPEDIGGIFGYYRFLEILKDPDHPEYEEMKDWVGEDFDPEKFDIEKVNRKLHKIK